MLRNVAFAALVDGATVEDVEAAVADAARVYQDRVAAAAASTSSGLRLVAS